MRNVVSNRDSGHFSSDSSATSHYLVKGPRSDSQLDRVVDRTLFAREDSAAEDPKPAPQKSGSTQRAAWLTLQRGLLKYSSRIDAAEIDLEDSQEFLRRRAGRIRAT